MSSYSGLQNSVLSESDYLSNIGLVQGAPAAFSYISSPKLVHAWKRLAKHGLATIASFGRKGAAYKQSASSDTRIAWDECPTWDTSSSSSGSWDSSCSTLTTSTSTLTPDPLSITINNITIANPFLASLLHTNRPLSFSPATKHHLATYLLGTIQSSCHSFLRLHAPWTLSLLRLETADAVDINVYITLLGHLLARGYIPAQAFAVHATGKGEVAYPNILRRFETESQKGDNIGRLRQVAVHRWDYDTQLLRDAVSYLALLKDNARVADVERVLQRVQVLGVDAVPSLPCTSKNGFLATVVRILERSLWTFARGHVVSTDGDHEHAMELHLLAERVVPYLASSATLTTDEVREIYCICRSLRNTAAHQNSFSAEAIQGRKDGGCVSCSHDAFEDPYTAIAEDAEKVAELFGDDGARREIRLALWAADGAARTVASKEDVSAMDFISLGKRARILQAQMNGSDMGWEAERRLFSDLGEAGAYLEGRTKDIFGEEAHDILEKLSVDVIGAKELGAGRECNV